MKRIIVSLATMAILIACDEMPLGVEDQIKSQGLMFTTSINQPTKATESDFETDDVIAVSAYDASNSLVKDAAQYTHNGSLFVSDEPIVYGADDPTYSFYAVYPTVNSLGSSLEFRAKADQSVAGAYEDSDILYASVSSSDIVPKLSFYHKMSCVVVTIAGDKGGEAEFSAKLGMDLDVVAGSVAAKGGVEAITPAVGGAGSFKLIIAPQEVSAQEVFATYTVGGLTYDWVFDSDMEFEAGSQYTFTWSLADREVTLESVINGWDVIDSGTIESK